MNILDKYEFRIKLDEINDLVGKKDYKGAMEVVDSIDWRRVKTVHTLCVVGEIYAANKRYEDSKEIFLLAYHRAPIGKNILYRLVEVSLKMKDFDEAVEFYEEYKEVAPNDNAQYVLKYKISRAKNESINEQIKILEEYKEKEFTEKWSYELAKLYYKKGDKSKCLDICNEIILWFSEGSYVMKALDLKMRMGVLTGEEKEKYEKQFIPKLVTSEDVKALKESKEADEGQAGEEIRKDTYEEKEGPVIDTIRIRSDKDLSGTETLQDKISKGIRDIFGGNKKTEEDSEEGTQEETKETPVQEEMIKSSSDEELKNVPVLEREGEKRQDYPEALKMPELNIPSSMKNIDLKEALTPPDIKAPNNILSNMSESAASNALNDIKDFNLEDTILAAASAQGIEIPEEEEVQSAETEKEAAAEESYKEESFKEGESSAEEEPLTEEDLQKAEEEFLNGPADIAEPVKKAEEEIPALEAEEEIENQEMLDDSDLDDDEFISKILKEDVEEEEEEFPVLEEDYLSEEEKLENFIESIQPKDESDPMNIIPRKQELTEDEKKLFTYFVKVPGVKEQLINTLCDVQAAAADKTSKTGNIIVMGGRETGKTRLISSLIPAICKELNLEASKVAYVFAEQINGKDISKIAEKLAGGFLVIENANQLDQATAEQLDQIMESETDSMIIIIEDEKIGMRKLIARYPKLAKKFTSMINIPVFTNDELVNFAKVYTKENGYKIDQMGMLALYNLITINQKEDEPMNIGTVKNMIDSAIEKSQGGMRKFKRNVSKKRMDRDGFILLYEKDFK